jgi:3-oxoacyl-[acyl-carrier protein] reductase
MSQLRTALVIGAARPFGAEIVALLEAEGYAVTAAPDASAPDIAASAGPLDAFVLNTPVRLEGLGFLEISDADFERVLTAQVYELVAAGQAAAARLRPGGRMVVVASRAHLGAWGGAHQIASGAALVAMCRSMALELEAQGIAVNVVAPDFVGEAWDTPAARTELAAIVVFLLGSGGLLLTGQTLLLDQARSLRMTEAARR